RPRRRQHGCHRCCRSCPLTNPGSRANQALLPLSPELPPIPAVIGHMDHTERLAAQPHRNQALWTLTRGRSPLIGTAIHDGHIVSDDLLARMALDEPGRLREEDPFTARFIADIDNR